MTAAVAADAAGAVAVVHQVHLSMRLCAAAAAAAAAADAAAGLHQVAKLPLCLAAFAMPWAVDQALLVCELLTADLTV